jgi:hypothetical protein
MYPFIRMLASLSTDQWEFVVGERVVLWVCSGGEFQSLLGGGVALYSNADELSSSLCGDFAQLLFCGGSSPNQQQRNHWQAAFSAKGSHSP